MSKYGFGNFLPLPLVMLFFLFSLFFPLMALCQLSSEQNATMIKLTSLLNNTRVHWDATKDPNPCSWEGVRCGNTSSSSGTSSFVVNLTLHGFGLSDSAFLPVVCQLETLRSLDVSDNFLNSIPDNFTTACGGINGLKVLNFTRNRLSGPLPAFTGFRDLEILDLSFNSLGGNASLQLGGLAALKSLNLSFNLLTGPLPMSHSETMEELVLSMNFFHGSIPVEIGNYQKLRVLDLSSNPNLSGVIPDAIGNLPNLNILVLSLSSLGGEIPASISNITTLKRFAANQNKFTGTIPSGITRFLTSLDLSYNSLRGSMPSDFLSPRNLQIVDMSYNSLDGPIPSKLSPSLYRLRLGSNSLNGTIPNSFSFLKNLTYLELDNNSLSGQIPASLGSCEKLALLNLAQNRLTGPLPTLLGNLSKLEVLKLQLNNLSGAIPTEITQLPRLSILNVSWNSLNGSIPSSVSNLQSLSHLNLQGNSLSGPIPDTISGVNSLLELQLGQNHIGGRIPEMPPKLQIALNLSSNLFQGPIPSTFAQLKDLEILDLSNNSFSGEIPDFLTSLGSLTQLILSNNELTGVIPDFRHWVSVSASGNPGLRNRTVTPTYMPTSKKSKHIAVAAVLSVAAVVLVAVAVTLLVLSKRFPKVNDEQSQSGEAVPPPQVVHGNLLTANGIHRSNIDFAKAMETVADPLNIVLKTRFSTYYKATMPAGACYYVKKLNWSDKIFQLGSHDKFEQELEVLGKLSNSNVMTPLAYVLTVDSAYLFYEYAQKGTLFDVLHGKLGDALDWASRYSIAVGVAQGLTFLHGCTPNPVLLLDLSSRNILLRSLKEPLVGDIELCKVIDPTKSTGSLSAVAGSVGYIPPEYAYTMRVTMAGNVYSFGVILLELLTGKPAVSEGTELAKWVLSKSAQQDRWDHILDFSISRTSPAVRGQMLAVLKVARSCVSLSPDARPKMKSVLRMILNAR